MNNVGWYGQSAWTMPKWLGIGLGIVFSSIALVATWMIVDLTRPSSVHATAPIARSSAAMPAAMPAAMIAPAPAASTATLAAASAPASPNAALQDSASTASRPKHHSSHHASHSRRHGAVAKHSGNHHGHTTMARHNVKEKRKRKDDLDRLLGL